MKETTGAGGVVIGPNKKILVVNQNGRSWSLPKGHIDPGEDAETAARREIHEESGVEHLELIRELGSYERFKIALDGGDDKSESKTLTFFLFTTSQTTLSPIDPKNPEARWVEPDKVASLLTHRKDKGFFRKIFPLIEDYLS